MTHPTEPDWIPMWFGGSQTSTGALLTALGDLTSARRSGRAFVSIDDDHAAVALCSGYLLTVRREDPDR